MSKITADDLKLINQYTRKELAERDVYTFKIILCDNQVDKDCEKISIESLKTLSKLFLGKTGIFDSSNIITSRIYKTYIVTDYNKTECGEPYTYLGAEAYVIKSDKSELLINELESGYKKEVSISCSFSTLRCSICNQDVKRSQCIHTKGNNYNGVRCHYILECPTDAYEWAFVKPSIKPKPKKAKVVARKSTKYNKSRLVRWTPAYQSYYSVGDEAQSFCPVCDEEVVEDEHNNCKNCGCELIYR